MQPTTQSANSHKQYAPEQLYLSDHLITADLLKDLVSELSFPQKTALLDMLLKMD